MSKLDTLTDADLQRLTEGQNRIADAIGTPEPDSIEWARGIAQKHRETWALCAASWWAEGAKDLATWNLSWAAEAAPYCRYDDKAAVWLNYIRQVQLFSTRCHSVSEAACRTVFRAFLNGEAPDAAAESLDTRLGDRSERGES